MAEIKFTDDSFSITAAEPWIKEKVAIIRQYLSSFVLNLHGRIDELVFVDLSAGNGLYSLGAKKEIFAAPSLMALSLDLPINRYIFCEADNEQSGVLKIRTNKYFRGKNVIHLEGKPEELIDKLQLYVPQSKGNYKVAVFCLCDPFSLDIPFNTISKLNDLGFSFLIPFTFVLNDHLNYKFYTKEQREKVSRFLGGFKDIERLEKDLTSNTVFYKRLIHIFENNMLALGLNAATSVHKIDSGLMEVPMYYTGLFSKQFATKAILQDVESARNVQFDLFKL
ncbi:MAG TPA: three-Cys-motif partner protein TcmP [Cyclobacteriaceae bacterium]